MWDSAAEANRWWEQAGNDLEFARMALREEFFHQACFIAQQCAQYYIPTRYPNGLPGGVPFAAFHEPQARAAIEAAERFAELARSHLAEGDPGD